MNRRRSSAPKEPIDSPPAPKSSSKSNHFQWIVNFCAYCEYSYQHGILPGPDDKPPGASASRFFGDASRHWKRRNECIIKYEYRQTLLGIVSAEEGYKPLTEKDRYVYELVKFFVCESLSNMYIAGQIDDERWQTLLNNDGNLTYAGFLHHCSIYASADAF